MANYRIKLDGTPYDPTNFGEVNISLDLFDENGGYFFRRKLTDQLKFKKDAYIYILQQITLGQCQQISVEIEQLCGGVYESLLVGYFTRQACVINYEICSIEVETNVVDAYSCIVDNQDKGVNFLATDQLSPDDIAYTPTYGLEVTLNNNGGSPTCVASLAGYGSPYTLSPYSPATGEYFCIYARYIAVTRCVAGIPQEPPPALTAWTLLENNCAINGTAKYFRNVQPSEILFTFFDYTCSGALCVPTACGLFCIDAGVYPYGILQNFRYCACPSYTQFFIPNGRKLTEVIDFILSVTCPTLTLDSELLTNETNYVTGSTANPLTDLFIFQKSDVVRASASEWATNGTISIKNLMSDLSLLLNSKWDVVGSNLRFEHISIFLSNTIGTDLTVLDGGKWDIGRSVVSFDNEEVPNAETFTYANNAQDVNFVGYPIAYDTECSGKQIDSRTEFIETELTRIFQNPNEGLEGFVLVAIESILPDDAKVENGEVTNTFIPNAPLAWSNLHRDYFTYYRYLQDGDLNNTPTVFDSTRPIKRQENIEFPVCCLNDFNPLDLVKTSIGDGRVVAAEYNLSSQKIKVTLKFEDL